MSDLDLDRLGDLWRQPPDPAELRELKRTAELVRSRARWSQVVDAVAAIVVSGVVAILVFRNPETDTLLIGGGVILILLLSQIRQRKLRAAELQSLTGTTEQMLDQSIERVRATIKRARSGLIVAIPGVLLGVLFAYVVEGRSGGELAARVAAYPGLGTAIKVAGGVALALMMAHLLRQLRRNQRELERLTQLREAFRQEEEDSKE
ncbi:MAG: hypothetical protein ACXWUN_08535 [Allosphingosinicella sp.]